MAKSYRLPTPKGTRERLVSNLDRNLLECGMAAIRAGQIRGNVGMHHGAMAAAAIALNREPETSRALDWLFEPNGGNLPAIIMSRIDRDGIGDEASPGYSLGWIGNLSGTAERLAAYGGYDRWDLYRDFPRFTAGFNTPRRLAVLDWTTVNIGDTGRTGNISLMKYPEAEAVAETFRHTGDERLALAAYWSNGYTADGLGRNIDRSRSRGAFRPNSGNRFPPGRGRSATAVAASARRLWSGPARIRSSRRGHGRLYVLRPKRRARTP